MNRPEDRWKIADGKRIEAGNQAYLDYMKTWAYLYRTFGWDIEAWTNNEVRIALHGETE